MLKPATEVQVSDVRRHIEELKIEDVSIHRKRPDPSTH